MIVNLRHPGVYIEEIPSGVRTIAGVSTSTALFIGWAARGTIDRAVRLASFADYEREYGGLDMRTLLGYSMKHFFDNGGSDAYVVRINNDAKAAETSVGFLTITAASPGAWAEKYKVKITCRAAPNRTRFKVEVFQGETGQESLVESFEDLSMEPNDRRFVEKVVSERSTIVQITAVPGATPTDSSLSAFGWSTPGIDGTPFGPDDGAFRTAMLTLFSDGAIADQIDIFNLVCVPGLTDDTTISTLQGHCRKRRAFLLVDADPSATTQSLNANPLPSGLTGSDATYAAFYFPWVKAPDPMQSGAIRAFPPCGFVAGLYARTDATRGVWKAPAGSEASLNGASGLELTMSDTENGWLNPKAINCLRTLPVYGNVVWGARTLHGDNDRASEWKYVPVRRMALFIEESLYRGTQWVVFEPNDEPLWAQIRLNVSAFMNNLFRQGAFQGRTPREAYFVKCDRTTTTQADIDLGIVNIHVGFAPLKPAEFVVIKLQQIAGELAS